MVRIFKTKWFSRWARKEQLSDSDLIQAVDEIVDGLIEAKLGSMLYKKRVARGGQGKRGGYRTIIAFRSGDKAFYLFGFDKGARSNIRDDEEVGLKRLAKEFMGYDTLALNKAIKNKALIEVMREVIGNENQE